MQIRRADDEARGQGVLYLVTHHPFLGKISSSRN